MDLQNLLKLQLFILYMYKNQQKILICLKGEKIRQANAGSVFCCFEHLFESQDDSFWVF
jgi:hypothetical protein